MKMNKICYWVVIYGFMFALEACRESTPEFTVTGIVAGADGQTMYMENIGLSDIRLIDSVKLNSSGKFTFKTERPKYPDFYRLRLGRQWINFAIDSTETVTFTADAKTFATSQNNGVHNIFGNFKNFRNEIQRCIYQGYQKYRR